MALIEKLGAIGDAIREKTGSTEKLALDAMPAAIQGITTGGTDLPEDVFIISGDCKYRFANNGWNWFIEDYGNKITTKDVRDSSYMFADTSDLTQIPFCLNFISTNSFHNTGNMFNGCNNLLNVPRLNGLIIYSTNNMFKMCYKLREIPDEVADTWDWSYLEKQTTSYTGNQSNTFTYCYSLRSIPMNVINNGNPYAGSSYSYFYYGFQNCSSLDELVNLPIPYTKATWTNNTFVSTFNGCSRLKNITFALNSGQPYVVNWKSQTIDLSGTIGYSSNSGNITNYNSGITTDKLVKDDETYKALNSDPDWYTNLAVYSRYNHDSAVATINSLPDTSAYLASAGGTNTIKFRGDLGTNTDGGAINTLTEEEIAVATAKGWTVSLV